MNEMSTRKTVVVGGGITGLVVGLRMLQRVRSGEVGGTVTLVEGTGRLGGKIVTQRVDGCVIEGGPDTFLARKPSGTALCRELGLGDRLTSSRRYRHHAYVSRRARLHPLPSGLSGMVPVQLGPLLRAGCLTWRGRARALLEPLIRPRRSDADESVGAFARRRFGRETYDRLMEPLLSGIYAGNGDELSVLATMPHLPRLEQRFGSVIRGLRRAERADREGRGPAFVTLEGGMAELTAALEARLDGVEIVRGTPVTAVRRCAPGAPALAVDLADGRTIPADAVVLATPAWVSCRLVASLDSRLARTLAAIPFVSTATVSLAYGSHQVPHPLEGHGYLIPRAERRHALACSWTSSKIPGRAPRGTVVVRVFVGRAGREVADGVDDETLRATAVDEIRAVLGVRGEPVFARVFRYPKAMPQYTVGHRERLRAIDDIVDGIDGLFLAGHSYRGVGIPDCIRSAEETVALVVDSCRGVRPAR